MTDSTNKIGKLTFFGTVIAALIAGAVALYIHLDSKDDVKNAIESVKEKNNDKKQASVTIEEVFVTPVSFEIPANFYTEIVNSSLETAEGFYVTLDFGRSKIQKCSIKPSFLVKDESKTELGIKKLLVPKLLRNESIYISCTITEPAFEKVIIAGGNLSYERILNFSGYEESRRSEKTNGLWIVLFMFFIIPFGLFLMVVLMRLISKWSKLKW